MKYEEFQPKIGTEFKEGDIFYICDFRLNEDLRKKPIRNIKPVEVMLVNNDKITTDRTIYYSEYHFRELKKNREYSSKIIAPYDGTGYRSYTGKGLHVFTTKDECIDFFIEQCEEAEEIAKKDSLSKFSVTDIINLKTEYLIHVWGRDIGKDLYRNKRDPDRIEDFLNLLKQYWLLHPYLRFAQVYGIIESEYGEDIFYVEEDRLEDTIRTLIVKDGKK